ncbi:MAG TPA: glycosyltransferase family 39 protein [Candidatus Sulfotelmatobacter sp.]|nr:glycosyltransferase family 39 protein [Candidatus Sulfotelmatobacter sp.]
MVLAGLAIRLIVVGFLYPERTDPARDHWRFGGEAGRIARSIAQGEGFSNPLFGHTGPTAWLSPVFPYLLAGIFKLFGIYSKASALVALSLDSLFSALTCIPVFLIARMHFGGKTALWAGWAWAFFPYGIYFSADFIWATSLTTLLMSLVFLSALRLESSSRTLEWVVFGALSGLGALTDPVILSVAPFLGAWMWYRRREKKARWFVPGIAAVLTVVIVTAPWMIRNYRIFHKIVPFRSCLGLEVYFGNNRDTWHWGPPGYHPSDNEEEWKEYQQLGEIAYVSKKLDQGLDFIDHHRGLYVWMTMRRVVYLWTGYWSFSPRYLHEEPMDPANIVFCTFLTVLTLDGLRRAWRGNGGARNGVDVAMPYIIVFFFFPIVYYLTHPEDYYRRPIDPLFVVLAAYSVVSWRQERLTRRAARGAV